MNPCESVTPEHQERYQSTGCSARRDRSLIRVLCVDETKSQNPPSAVATARLATIGKGDTKWRATLSAHHLPPDQERFTAPATESLTKGDADPGRLSVAILVGDEPVGMFAVDRGGYFREFDRDPHAVLLRAFYVAPEHQGRGYARAAIVAIPDFMRRTLPDVHRVVLTVNHQNPAAIRAYLSAGFTDSKKSYLGGSAGPQHIFELTV